jgi:hypothetical protein
MFHSILSIWNIRFVYLKYRTEGEPAPSWPTLPAVICVSLLKRVLA